MQFILIDRITDLQPGKSVTAVKALTLAEEYLKDHFPRFPVMPGVLMLEAMFQASAWLVYYSEDFAKPYLTLKEARNIKYNDFVKPGELLTLQAEIVKHDDQTTSLKAQGFLGESLAVSGRLVLQRSLLVERFPDRPTTDGYMRQRLRQIFRLLYPSYVEGAVAPAAGE